MISNIYCDLLTIYKDWTLTTPAKSYESWLRLEGHRPLMFLRKNNVWCLCSICYWYQTLITFYWWLDWTWQDCSWKVALSAVLPGHRTELKYRLSHRTPQICQKWINPQPIENISFVELYTTLHSLYFQKLLWHISVDKKQKNGDKISAKNPRC